MTKPTDAITDLIAAGLSEKDIGAAVGASQKTINRYRRGEREPSYSLGLRLIGLADRVKLEPEVVASLRRPEAAKAGGAAFSEPSTT